MVSSAATTVADYLAELPPERAAIIEEVRDLVLANLPDGIEESMNFGMIAYEVPLSRYAETYNGKPLLYAALAAQKNNYALYLHGVHASDDAATQLRDAYAEADMKLDMGKSCLRFKRLDQLLPGAVASAISQVSVDDFVEIYEAGRAG